MYIRKNTEYLLSVSDSGFLSYHGRLNATQDTTLTITLSTVNRFQTPKPGEGGQPSTDKNDTGKNFWWIPAMLLGIVIGAGIGKTILDKRKRESQIEPLGNPLSTTPNAEETISKLNEQLKQKDGLINKYAGEIQILHAGFKPSDSKYFLTEMMMTAGPRKRRMDEKDSDKDLGEDVCGFIMIGDEVLAWVLDGTSDYFSLHNPETHREYFSSRLLAQSLARELKAHFGEGKMEAFDQTMIKIIGDVKSNWLATIAQLPEDEKTLLKANVQSGVRPECATTVLIGRLSLGGELVAYRSGDSKMLVYRKSDNQKVFLDTSLSSKNPRSNDRVFFRIVLTEKGELDIQHNNPDFEIVQLDKIQTIIGMSDGIGKETENDLKKEYPQHSEEMRKEIIYQLQGTEDDKSLFIIEIKE